jgi:hypothetical protein
MPVSPLERRDVPEGVRQVEGSCLRERRQGRFVAGATALWVLVSLLTATPSAGTPRATQRARAAREAREIRTVWTTEFGIPRPTGLTYLPVRGELLVAQSRGDRTAALRLSLGQDPRGTLDLPRLPDASTLAFDPSSNLLTAVRAGAQIAAPAGDLGTWRVSRADVRGLGLLDPSAATFDPSTGTWFVLDEAADAVVRAPRRGGPGSATRISLKRLGASRFAGIAFNPSDGLLYVADAEGDRLFGLDGGGRIRRTHSLASLDLRDPRAMTFAPSADRTDDPGTLHLYVADAGDSSRLGGVMEVSLAAAEVAAAEVVTATLVQTIDTSRFDPPSPDPAGIEYLPATDHLMIADSEVDETTGAGFHGVNLWKTTRTGSVADTGDVTSYTKEPTGLGFDAVSNTLFISTDSGDRVYVTKPGADGRFGTSDDNVTFVNAGAYGSGDTEDPEFDPASGHLFFVDGTNAEVYRIDPVNGVFGDGNDVMTHFDVGAYGASDPEGLGSDPRRGTLLVGDRRGRRIYEVTKTGALVRIIDASGIPGMRYISGLAMAPATNSATGMNYWIVDRAVDNGADSSENDGKIFEVGLPSSDPAPTVSITSPVEGATVSGIVPIQADASDDQGVTRVQFFDGSTLIGTDADGSNGWSASWNTEGAAEGPHTITATATDTIGQTGSDSNTVTVDNADGPPSVSITSPAEGATVSGVVEIRANASDDQGVTQVQFFDGATLIGTDTDGSNGWSASWITVGSSEGPHTIVATATDTIGQTGSDSNAVTVNNVDVPPSVSISSPGQAATVSGTVQVQANASDDEGVTQVRFLDGATGIGSDTDGSNGWSVSWNTVGAADGIHNLTAVATDTAGQTTTSVPVAVTVDNTVENLLRNPGFEEGRTAWSNGTVVTSPVHSGTRALLMTPISSGARHSNQTVAVSGGVEYQASGWIKVNGLAGGAVIRIQWRNASGTLLRTDVIGTKLTGTVDWRWSSAARTAPSTATQARFMLRIERESDGSGRAWFDDLSFRS